MGIESIRIENFRTCRSVELSNLGHLTVLVGRNGVGKSNILRGIEWAAKAASSAGSLTPGFVINPSSFRKGGIAINMKFRTQETSYHYSSSFSLASPLSGFVGETLDICQENQKSLSLFKREQGSIYNEVGDNFAEIDRLTPCAPFLSSLRPLNETKQHILEALKFLRGIRYYPLDEPSDFPDFHNEFLISRQKYLEWLQANEWLESAEELSDLDESIAMRLLHMHIEKKDDFDELCTILGLSGLGLLTSIEIKNTTISVRHSARNSGQPRKGRSKSNMDGTEFYIIRFVPGQGWENSNTTPLLKYEALSYGTRRIIRLLVSIFYDKSSVYLLEQPEDGIHPQLLKDLIEVLRAYSDKGQVIMASHSSALLDVLQPEEVRLVTMVGGETQVRALSDFDLEGAKLFMENKGSLSEYLSLLPED